VDPEVAFAALEDLEAYARLAGDAQSFLASKGLAQWVPAAHAAFMPELCAKAEARTLRKVMMGEEVAAFFDFSLSGGQWWNDERAAAYLSGIVVARLHSHQGVGDFILEWCSSTAVQGGAEALRLDCHAGNAWLCEYYRSRGFRKICTIEQHPGYFGVLFEKDLRPGESASR
jgi:ribosomal protein S18 acetylase RimI-like enzyme